MRCPWRVPVPRRVAAVLLLAVSVGCGPPGPEVPVPGLEGAEARVQSKITQLVAQLGEKPQDAPLWGRYAMALEAHGFVNTAAEAYRQAHALDPEEFLWPYFLAALADGEEPETAVRWYSVALGLDAGYAPAHIRMATVLEKLARFEEARVHYREAAKLDATNPFAPLGLGRLALRRDDVEGGLAHLERAYELAPEVHAVVSSLAQGYLRAGDEGRARRHAAAARDLPRITYQPDPRRSLIKGQSVDLRSFVRRGQAHLDQGNLDQALREVAQALKIDPTFADAHFAAAEIYLRQKSFRQAERSVRAGLDLTPNRSGARPLLARALFELGRFSEAEQEVRKALDQDPADGNMYLLRGRLRAQRGEKAAALEDLRRAVQMRPQDTAWRLLLASVLTADGRLAEAEAELEKVLRLTPEDGSAWAELGFVHLRTTALPQAVRAFEKAVSLGHPRALPGLIQSLLQTAGPDAALGRTEDFVRHHPEHIEARILLAELLTNARRPREAAAHLQHILALEPQNAEAWLQLGYTQLALGEPRQATTAFGRCLELATEPFIVRAAREGLTRAGAQ